jgi:hypothetical protein
VGQEVSQQECLVLVAIAVVENENELTALVLQCLERVGDAAGKFQMFPSLMSSWKA